MTLSCSYGSFFNEAKELLKNNSSFLTGSFARLFR